MKARFSKVRRIRPTYWLFFAPIACSLNGCFQPAAPQPEQRSRGCILLLPGVECTTQSMAGIYRGLRDAGYDGAIDLDIWGYRPFGTFRNLRAYELNRQRAARIAEKLATWQAAYPQAPLTVIGYSGGGAMALFVAEALPEEVVLNRLVLLGAAISPTYDIGAALRRCRHGIVNFYSQGDWFMGGWATETFGTLDRKKTEAAGRRGFHTEEGELLRAPGLTQIAWQREWRRFGHSGGHSGWLNRRWVCQVLAPYVWDCPGQKPSAHLSFTASASGRPDSKSLE